ncbi:unnamed protein product [Paramecium pentaurelia]|uniref:Thioredoxin domain-containing protein n=1 Tax=Paramecium pentaurelia TaxID=43138 RepID=A0A8S1XK75_9CILI|nr:unnamed protein product [Paramecium pentaurelia]
MAYPFYRPSCLNCQKVMPIWESLAQYNQTQKKDLFKLFSIDAVPNMILLSEGGNLNHNNCNRTNEFFIIFVDRNWYNNQMETSIKQGLQIFNTTTICFDIWRSMNNKTKKSLILEIPKIIL